MAPPEKDDFLDDEDEEEAPRRRGRSNKRPRSSILIDDAAVEDSDEDDDDDDDDDEEYYGGGGGSRRKKHKRNVPDYIDDKAEVDDDEEEEDEEDEGEAEFLDDMEIRDEDGGGGRRMHRPFLPREVEDGEDIEEMERQVNERYSRSNYFDYDDEEEAINVDQQSLLPCIKDPKLWKVNCAIGREREVAACLMQKYLDGGCGLKICSAVALDHLKGCIYVEADKEAHVVEACKGLRLIYTGKKITLVPIKEMTGVLSVERKTVDISRDTWVRMKIGTYKGDLAKVVDVDNVRQKVTVKLIPRVDLQALADKLDGKVVQKKKAFVPPQRFMNMEEARELHIRVERRRDSITGEYFENINGLMFKDGFLYKTVSMKSIRTDKINPSFDELEKFRQPGEDGDEDMATLSTLFANRKKGHFMKGDQVIVVKGDLKTLRGWVEKVEDNNVHFRPNRNDLPGTVAVNEKDICKYFEPGNHVKVVTGASEGTTGMVIKVEGHVVIILSDTAKEHIRVFSDNVVESSEVTTGVTKIGDYELHDLVMLDNMSFGLIIRVESEAFHVLKGVPGRPEVCLVRVREIKHKLDRRNNFAQDRFKNSIAVKDVVKIVEGPLTGKQGPVEHMFKGILFIHDRHHLEHAGFLCSKSQSCIVVGGSKVNGNRNVGALASRFAHLGTPQRVPQSPGRGPRGGPPMGGQGRHRGGRGGHDPLIGTTVKVHQGHFKGYRGRVVDVKGSTVRVELESQMKVVTVDRNHISDKVAVSTPHRDLPVYGSGSETSAHPSRTPLHPCMTPMRDPGATPIHDGMRTPMRDRAWNPYSMTPQRDSTWGEDGNPGSWVTSPQYQPGSPTPRTFDAPTPGSGWANPPARTFSVGTPRDSSNAYANDPSASYLPSTPGQPMTPSSDSYLPGTPGGLPMTPVGSGMDIMSPVVGGDGGLWFLPDILVTVLKPGERDVVGVVREVLPDGSYLVDLGSRGNGDTVTVLPGEAEAVAPRKNDRIKIMSGVHRGTIGTLIGVDGGDGIVKFDGPCEVKIFDLNILAKLVPQSAGGGE